MTKLGPLSRAVALAGLLVSACSLAAPAIAAQADVELLKSYLGSWKGRGTLVGASSETVVCKLSLTEGNEEKVNYSGRCTLAGSNLSINGTLAYVDEKQRYEAVMTSNATFSGVAVGRKQRGGVVFNLKEREKSEGEDYDITATFALAGGAINVDFHVTDVKSGETIKASVPFAK